MAMLKKLKDFLIQCKKTLKIAKKPTGEEIYRISRVCLLGLALLGSIGMLTKFSASLFQNMTLII